MEKVGSIQPVQIETKTTNLTMNKTHKSYSNLLGTTSFLPSLSSQYWFCPYFFKVFFLPPLFWTEQSVYPFLDGAVNSVNFLSKGYLYPLPSLFINCDFTPSPNSKAASLLALPFFFPGAKLGAKWCLNWGQNHN